MSGEFCLKLRSRPSYLVWTSSTKVVETFNRTLSPPPAMAVSKLYRHQFDDLWARAMRESPLAPDGAVDQLMSRLADFLDVEQIQHVAVHDASAYLYDLTTLGLSGMGWNVFVVSRAPQSEEEARSQAEFLDEQKRATDSIGFCFYLYLENERPPVNPYIGGSLHAVFLGRAELETVFSSPVPKMTLAAIVRQQTPVARLCPFNTSQEASGAMFYGRRSELALLVEDFTKCIAIHGARRIGKTSLLKQAYRILKNRYHDESRRVYYFNCLTWDGYLHACQRLAHKIDPRREPRMELSDRNIEYLLERRSRNGSKPLLLFFDEVDRLIDLDSVNNWQFFSLLASAKDANHVRFVLAGYRSVDRLAFGDRSLRYSIPNRPPGAIQPPDTPLLLQMASLRLGPLGRREADSLFVEPLKLTDVALEGETSLQESVWRLTAGYPFFVQFVGQLLFRIAAKRGDHRLSADDVTLVEQDAELREFLETHFIENTQQNGTVVGVERCCAMLFAHSGDASWTEQDFWEGCRRHKIPLGADGLGTVHRAVKNLVDSQILATCGARHTFAFPAMKSVLTSCFPNLSIAIRAHLEN